MKKDIHPRYQECKVHCGCGNEFTTRATVKELRIEICSQCHPFYSGKQKFVDSAGRIDSWNQLSSGLANDVVYGIHADGDKVWAATAAGLSSFEPRTGNWEIFDTSLFNHTLRV